MSASKVIKQIMVERGISVKELALQLGMKSPQILSNKLYRDTFTYEDYIKTANLLGCTVQTITNDTKKIFLNEYIPAAGNPEYIKAADNKGVKLGYETFAKTKKPYEKQYKLFTDEEEKQIDLHELSTNVHYQLGIALKFGENVLASLMEKARQQQEPHVQE